MIIFPIQNDEQMSNKVGVEHQPVAFPWFVFLTNHFAASPARTNIFPNANDRPIW